MHLGDLLFAMQCKIPFMGLRYIHGSQISYNNSIAKIFYGNLAQIMASVKYHYLQLIPTHVLKVVILFEDIDYFKRSRKTLVTCQEEIKFL